MSKIIGYKYIGTVNGLQQFEPIIEGEKDLTQQIIEAWETPDLTRPPWSYNESWPFVNTSRWPDTLKPLKFKEDER